MPFVHSLIALVRDISNWSRSSLLRLVINVPAALLICIFLPTALYFLGAILRPHFSWEAFGLNVSLVALWAVVLLVAENDQIDATERGSGPAPPPVVIEDTVAPPPQAGSTIGKIWAQRPWKAALANRPRWSSAGYKFSIGVTLVGTVMNIFFPFMGHASPGVALLVTAIWGLMLVVDVAYHFNLLIVIEETVKVLLSTMSKSPGTIIALLAIGLLFAALIAPGREGAWLWALRTSAEEVVGIDDLTVARANCEELRQVAEATSPGYCARKAGEEECRCASLYPRPAAAARSGGCGGGTVTNLLVGGAVLAALYFIFRGKDAPAAKHGG